MSQEAEEAGSKAQFLQVAFPAELRESYIASPQSQFAAPGQGRAGQGHHILAHRAEGLRQHFSFVVN